MKRLSEYTQDVTAAIKSLHLAERRPASLYAPIEYAMNAGGKRLRPALTLMSAAAFGAPEEQAMSAALGLEMFHNFTLLHDDVMDESATRRGRQTVHVKWDSNTAILSGDTMLSLAEGLMMQVEDKYLRRVMEVFNRMSIEVYEGQAYDMEYEERDSVSTEEYIEMVRLKTGALLGACAEVGAIIGGASEAQAAEMREFGEMLGIAFQIEDDWLDTFGNAEVFGKPIGGDINNAKKTYLLTAGLNAATPDAEALRAAISLPAGELRVKTVTRIYEKMGVSETCRRAIAHYSSRALEAVKKTGLGESEIEPFKALLDKLTGRRV